jgi:glycosyltransferase involved in cell wall biosynthesis
MKNAKRFRRVIAPSEEARQRFLAAGFGEDQVVKIPYFCPLPVRDEPRRTPDTPTVTFLGRASYNKGWEVFIAAVGKLPDGVHGLLVGNFSEGDRREIKRLAESAGCEQRLEIEGWVGRDAIHGIFERTTVLAFPSLWPETLGIVGLEAMANGAPVVASDVGGVREWLIDGETGYLAKPGDAKGLAGKLSSILQSEDCGNKLGIRGMELVKNKFAPARHLERLLEVYSGVSALVAGITK